MPTTPFTGNRLPLPSTLPSRSPHFLYFTQTPPHNPADLTLISKAAKHHLETKGLGLNPSQIELFLTSHLATTSPPAISAIERLLRAYNLPAAYAPLDPSILLCEWAAPHVDPSFCGQAFFSLVLHTGPNPYMFQTFYPTFSGTATVPELKSSTRVLNVGDTFIFDPTTPHFTAPLHPHEDQLLILLQIELPDNSPEERAALLQTFPPHPTDNDHAEIFNGYLP